MTLFTIATPIFLREREKEFITTIKNYFHVDKLELEGIRMNTTNAVNGLIILKMVKF